MNFIKTDIDDVVIIEPKVFCDERGYFFESFSQKEFDDNVGKTVFLQDNESKSCYGVLRGLHFQVPPFAQAKLVRCVIGKILDVAVDLRKGSSTYGKHVATELSEDNHRMLYIPRGFAHGFSVLSNTAVVQYKCDNYYTPKSENALQWNDKDLNINWLISEKQIILSEKDKHHPLFKDFESPFIIDKR